MLMASFHRWKAAATAYAFLLLLSLPGLYRTAAPLGYLEEIGKETDRLALELGRISSQLSSIDGDVCFRDCSSSSYHPICASDGLTYRNTCEYRVGSCMNPDLTVLNFGFCQFHQPKIPLPHTQESHFKPTSELSLPLSPLEPSHQPVAGDRSNLLEGYAKDSIRPEKVVSQEIILHRLGDDGFRSLVESCVMLCEDEKSEPVCGSNRLTYPNRCYLDRHRCILSATADSNHQSLYLERQGPCEDEEMKGTEATSNQPDDVCSVSFTCLPHYDPVCGSDGVFYQSRCNLLKSQCNRPELVLMETIELCRHSSLPPFFAFPPRPFPSQRSIFRPQYGPSSLLPQYGSSSLLPQYGSSSLLPQNGPSSPLPKYGPSSLLPQNGPSSLLPQYGPSSLLPQYGPSSLLPQYGPSSLLPQNGPSSLLPQYGSFSLLPPNGPSSLLPQYGPSSLLPQYGSSLLPLLSRFRLAARGKNIDSLSYPIYPTNDPVLPLVPYLSLLTHPYRSLPGPPVPSQTPSYPLSSYHSPVQNYSILHPTTRWSFPQNQRSQNSAVGSTMTLEGTAATDKHQEDANTLTANPIPDQSEDALLSVSDTNMPISEISEAVAASEASADESIGDWRPATYGRGFAEEATRNSTFCESEGSDHLQTDCDTDMVGGRVKQQIAVPVEMNSTDSSATEEIG